MSSTPEAADRRPTDEDLRLIGRAVLLCNEIELTARSLGTFPAFQLSGLSFGDLLIGSRGVDDARYWLQKTSGWLPSPLPWVQDALEWMADAAKAIEARNDLLHRPIGTWSFGDAHRVIRAPALRPSRRKHHYEPLLEHYRELVERLELVNANGLDLLIGAIDEWRGDEESN